MLIGAPDCPNCGALLNPEGQVISSTKSADSPDMFWRNLVRALRLMCVIPLFPWALMAPFLGMAFDQPGSSSLLWLRLGILGFYAYPVVVLISWVSAGSLVAASSYRAAVVSAAFPALFVFVVLLSAAIVKAL